MATILTLADLSRAVYGGIYGQASLPRHTERKSLPIAGLWAGGNVRPQGSAPGVLGQPSEDLSGDSVCRH